MVALTPCCGGAWSTAQKSVSITDPLSFLRFWQHIRQLQELFKQLAICESPATDSWSYTAPTLRAGGSESTA
eukprot:m.448962 g.448962  ORF g.448962 m.448962 type:complete len:72 (+) comp19746_c0_seq1:2078-2293(+)